MAKVKVIMILSAFLMVLWPGSLPQSVPRSAPVQVCDERCCYCCVQVYDQFGNCMDFSFHAICGPFFACHQEYGCGGTVCFWPMGISLEMICAVAFIGC
jgi:hypothetical protein